MILPRVSSGTPKMAISQLGQAPASGATIHAKAFAGLLPKLFSVGKTYVSRFQKS